MSPPATIELDTHDAAHQLRLAEIEKFSDGSGYVCRAEVQSGEFSYRGPFFFDDTSLRPSVEALELACAGSSSQGSATLKGQWETDFILFRWNEFGHVFVEGVLSEQTVPLQRLEFAFRTDQTVLEALARHLRLWLAA